MSVQPMEPPGYGQNMMHGQPPVLQQQVNTTVVVAQQPVAQNYKLVTSKYGHRDWTTGMFSCLDDVGKCALALFCQEFSLMDIANRTGECCLVPMCIPGGLVAIRARLRTLGGIQGSICKDYMALSCCYLCALCQMHRELDHMGL